MFEFHGQRVAPGRRSVIALPVSRLTTGTWMQMPVVVIHGSRPGPTAWVSGALHGDELNGISIVRQLITQVDPTTLSGTLLAVPIVNVHGVDNETRELPDRRDLNRSFPGSKRGSLASQVAHLFFEQVVKRCDFGLDFHTGSAGRSNLPQLRCDLDDPLTRFIAQCFAPPFALHAKLRAGSLRAEAGRLGIPVVVFEGGEAHRIDASVTNAGARGAMRVLRAMGMVPGDPQATWPWIESRRSFWLRAPRSGFCELKVPLGATVEKGDVVAVVHDTVGIQDTPLRAPHRALAIGALNTAQVHRGNAVIHLAEV